MRLHILLHLAALIIQILMLTKFFYVKGKFNLCFHTQHIQAIFTELKLCEVQSLYFKIAKVNRLKSSLKL